MKYYIITIFILLLIFSCNNGNNINNDKNGDIMNNTEDLKDLFSSKEIIFNELELDDNYTNDNKYYIKNVDANFLPLINSIQLSEEEKNIVIEQTGYFKDYFYTDSLFIDENIKITCLVGYMEKDVDKFNSFINLLRNMKDNNNIINFMEEYYTLNGKKNIQFKINIDNATYWFYVIFEDKNGYYLILNYTFPISYMEDSIYRIATSLNSITF